MAGANYMGGKRNAARARVKDTDARLQKSYFGKQRLAVLTKGLGNLAGGNPSKASPHTRLTSGDHISEITFAHAKHDRHAAFGRQDDFESVNMPAYICDDTSDPPAKRRKVEAVNASSTVAKSGFSASGSRILRALDMSNPLAMRAEMDRLLSHSDFAGLKSLQSARHAPPRNESCTRSHSHDRSIPWSSESTWQAPSEGQTQDIKLVCPTPSRITALPLFTASNLDFTHRRNDSSPRSSDFEPIQFDEDSGFAEAIREDTPYRFPSSEDTSFRFADSVTSTFQSSNCSQKRSDNSERDFEGEDRPGSWMLPSVRLTPLSLSSLVPSPPRRQHLLDLRLSAKSSTPLSGPSETSSLESSGISMTRFDKAMNDIPFLDRITARYPLASASIRADSASCSHLISSDPRFADTLSCPSHVSSDLGSAHFISDFAHMKSLSQRKPDTAVMKQTLLDTVQGRIFEHSDPWFIIKRRLDSSTPEDIQQPITEDVFTELRQVLDRHGVGYDTIASKNPCSKKEPRVTLYAMRRDEISSSRSASASLIDPTVSLCVTNEAAVTNPTLPGLVAVVKISDSSAEDDQDSLNVQAICQPLSRASALPVPSSLSTNAMSPTPAHATPVIPNVLGSGAPKRSRGMNKSYVDGDDEQFGDAMTPEGPGTLCGKKFVRSLFEGPLLFSDGEDDDNA